MSAPASLPAGPMQPTAGVRPAPARRRPAPGPVARRAGHVLGALVDVLLLVALLGWPGWRAVPFLTEDFRRVLGILIVSLVLNAAAELVYALVDRPRAKAVGDLLTLSVSLLVTVRLWQVFPFDVTDAWATVFRVLLVLGVVGIVIGMLVALVTAVRPRPER